MAMITDPEYVLQAIRLSALRSSGDPLAPRIISLDPSFSLNPYINASGLSDLDRWPEIKRALDSPPPDLDGYSSDDRPRPRRRAASGDGDERPVGRGGSGSMGELGNKSTGRSGLNYTQTIMGGKSGGLGMRVTGRASRDKKEGRANSSSAAATTPHSPTNDKTPRNPRIPAMDGFFSPSTRPRADSAPAPNVPEIRQPSSLAVGSSMLTSGRGMGVSNMDAVGGILEHALSVSETSGDIFEDGEEDLTGEYSRGGFDDGDIGQSARPGDLSIDAGGIIGRLGGGMVDEGSDVDEEDIEEEEGEFDDDTRELPEPEATQPAPSRGSRSLDGSEISEKIDFKPIAIGRPSPAGFSALTAALNKHIPHLVSTSSANAGQGETIANPFMSLYTSVAAPSTSIPSVTLELYFPHSSNETVPLVVKVRRDATVEEVTGYGLFKYWEEGRKPLLQDEESDQRWSTVGWGLRIVEDDGEVDEDFPPLDRDSQIAKFSYGQFAVVEATDTQIRQNTAKAPLIQRRPSRIIAPPIRTKPSIQGKPSFGQPGQASTSTDQQSSQQHNRPPQQSRSTSTTSLSSTEMLPPPNLGSSALKGSVGLSSALSKTVLLKVRVTASADVRFTTTISAPSDMYIADLTEVLCRKKRLQGSSADWVLCLADLTLALPLDRTVASLEGRIDLALVRRQWAVEHGLRIGDRRGGDPSASIFKRMSEPAPLAKFGAGMTDISQAYKKYRVQRKIAIGRHERVLAIDGDYIHIMPSESRAFFDSMKTTSFHVSLVASCKLTGRAGGFKINVWREGDQKRYEFEAENGRQAAEIISSIRQLMKSYQAERNSTVLAPRAPRR